MNQQTVSETGLRTGGARAWFIYSLSALTFGYAFFHRVAPSVMVSDLMVDFAIGAALLGTLSSLYFYPYVAMQIVLGPLIDRIGPRMILATAVMTGAAGSFLFGIADHIYMAYIGRLLIGIGSAVGFLATLAIAGKWFPPHRFAFLSGLVMFFGMMSGVFASGPLALLIENYGWRNVMYALGFFSILLAASIVLFVRNEPGPPTSGQVKPKDSWGDMWRGLGKAIASREVWKIAFVASAMSGPMLALGTLWATPYLMAAYDLERPNAAFLVSLMLMGWAFGAPFSGWLSDRIRVRKNILVIAAGLLTLAMCAIIFVRDMPLSMTVILFVLIGITGAAMTVCFALVRELNPANISGSVTGIVNSMTVASGAVLQPVVGLLLDLLWDGTTNETGRVHSASDYQTAFSVILIVTAAGFLVSLTLKESPELKRGP